MEFFHKIIWNFCLFHFDNTIYLGSAQSGVSRDNRCTVIVLLSNCVSEIKSRRAHVSVDNRPKKKTCKLVRRRPDKKEVIDMTLSSMMVIVEVGIPKWVDNTMHLTRHSLDDPSIRRHLGLVSICSYTCSCSFTCRL
jgi:hypothetical protein